MTNPPSPVGRWTHDSGVETSMVILTGVCTVKISKEAQTKKDITTTLLSAFVSLADFCTVTPSDYGG